MITIIKYAYHVNWNAEGRGVNRPISGGSIAFDFTSYLANYYTKLELQTSGQSSVHFDNITDAFHNNLLDLQGGLSTSSGDSSGKDAEYYHLDYESYALITDTPGVNKYFGTNGSGERGWYDYVTDSGCLWEEMSDGMLTPSNSNIVDLYILGDIHTDDDDSNVKLGVFAFASVTSGYSNIAIGKNALHSNTSGPGNIAIGESALYTNTEAQANIAIGYQALYANTVGELNIAVGFYALLANTEGSYNVGIGLTPLYSNTVGELNVSIGFESLYNNTSGNNNLAIGFRGLHNNTSGNNNIGIGYSTIFANTSGNNNIGIGSVALSNVSTGSNNIGIGYQAYVNDGEDINEIVIGNETTGQGSNTTIIGGANTIATYLISDIYVVTIDSFGTITPGLPLADSDITQVVMYDPTTGKLYYGAGEGGSVSYAFAMSLAESAGTVTLDNDEASPGNSKYYGTNGSGTKGWYDLPSGGGSAVDSTLLDWSTDRYQPYTTQQSGGEFYTDQNTIPDEVDYLGYNGTLGVYSLYSVAELNVGLSTSGIASTSWHVNMFGLTETYLASDVRCRFNPAVESYSGYDAYMFDTGGTLASDQWLSVWKHDGDIVASLDGDGKLYSNTFIHKYVIGDSSLISHYPEQTTTSESYTKLKTITLGSNIGINTTLRIRFDLKLDPVGLPPWAYGRIYRNGIAVGTERETGSSSYTTYSEDITDWNAGDTVELWVRTYNSGYTAYVRDFTICGSHNSIANEVTGTIS